MIIKQVVETPVTVINSLIQDYTQQKSLIQFTINGHISSLSLITVGFFLSLVKREAPKAWKCARLTRTHESYSRSHSTFHIYSSTSSKRVSHYNRCKIRLFTSCLKYLVVSKALVVSRKLHCSYCSRE